MQVLKTLCRFDTQHDTLIEVEITVSSEIQQTRTSKQPMSLPLMYTVAQITLVFTYELAQSVTHSLSHYLTLNIL
jgi:hypothetical protein